MSYADLEARLGAVAISRFANATLTPSAGVPISGVFTNDSMEAMVGMGVQASRLHFACALADFPNLVKGVWVVLNFRGQDVDYLVAEVLPHDVHLQTAAVLLRKAT